MEPGFFGWIWMNYMTDRDIKGHHKMVQPMSSFLFLFNLLATGYPSTVIFIDFL